MFKNLLNLKELNIIKTSGEFNILINENQFITSHNFARISDFIFSETLTQSQYKKINRNDRKNEILGLGNNQITYQATDIILNENDLIFCNSSRIELLFYYLSNVENLKNIKLITHQTDLTIDKKLFIKNQNVFLNGTVLTLVFSIKI